MKLYLKLLLLGMYVYLPSSEKMFLFSKTNGCVRVFQMKYLTIYILKLLFTMKLHLNFFWLKEKAILRFVQRASCQGMAKKSRNTTGGPGQHAAMENNACKFDEARKVKKE